MTLSTKLNFLEPVDVEKLFGLARTIVGIPAEQPFKVQRLAEESYSEGCAPDVVQLRSQSGGFDAMVWVTVVPSGAGGFDRGHSRWCADPEEGCHCHRYYAQLDLDTAYAFEPCCTCLHYSIINRLLEHFPGVPFEWQDEYTGDWYSSRPPARAATTTVGCLACRWP